MPPLGLPTIKSRKELLFIACSKFLFLLDPLLEVFQIGKSVGYQLLCLKDRLVVSLTVLKA